MDYFHPVGWRGLLEEAGVLGGAEDPYGSLSASAAGRPTSGSSPSPEEPKPEEPVAEPEPEPSTPGQVLFDRAGLVFELTERRAETLAQLDLIEVELRQAVSACEDALRACALEEAA
jgi:hypothetical protein